MRHQGKTGRGRIVAENAEQQFAVDGGQFLIRAHFGQRTGIRANRFARTVILDIFAFGVLVAQAQAGRTIFDFVGDVEFHFAGSALCHAQVEGGAFNGIKQHDADGMLAVRNAFRFGIPDKGEEAAFRLFGFGCGSADSRFLQALRIKGGVKFAVQVDNDETFFTDAGLGDFDVDFFAHGSAVRWTANSEWSALRMDAPAQGRQTAERYGAGGKSNSIAVYHKKNPFLTELAHNRREWSGGMAQCIIVHRQSQRFLPCKRTTTDFFSIRNRKRNYGSNREETKHKIRLGSLLETSKKLLP